MSEECPVCGERGEHFQSEQSPLRACMNIDCRVNEFEVME